MFNKQNIIITKSKRKTYSIEVSPHSEIKIRVPSNFTTKDTDEILEKHKKWIEKALKRNIVNLKNNLKNNEANKLFGIKKILIGGKWFKIKTFKSSTNRIHFKGKNLLVFLEKINDKEYQKAVITFFLKNMAREILEARICTLSHETGLEFNNFKISSAKKRWGSCSCATSINLNWRLIMLDEKLSNSVIYHELCHTKIMDHSSNFYKLLKQLDSDYKFHKLELGKYSFVLDY